MELREFVTEALLQVSRGIEDAQVKLQEAGSTSRINASMTKDDTGALVVGGRRHAIEFVEFDVAILANSGTETKAGIGLTVASLLNLNAGGKSNESKGTESRVKFRVPVAFPKHRYSDQNQQGATS
ncbi:hypothetical protein [Xanthomonas euvesicatoria]|uniref:hypothetical protein n=1 Tax=Xanthomonas euvesicatoria TaxID=456327 RepID=UPI001C43F01C|nr:hypothetical protein [Xanthomonas euvesicatoria]MBV6831148.1 hypothetical protein [Xanthomonas campestris pv. viegasii]MEB2231715.1 hypothetical protein [Xanthomonas campestris pv. campestris]